MSSLSVKALEPKAQRVMVTEDSIVVDLTDGRSVSAPLAWYPRLLHGKPEERNHWRLIGSGEGIHWPDLDEDLSVESLIAGRPSGESGQSFKRWLEGRETQSRRVHRAPRGTKLRGTVARKARRRRLKTSAGR